MMNEKDKPDLFDQLNGFYWNLGPDDGVLGPLLEVYGETVSYLERNLADAMATLVPGKTPLLHTVPYFKVPVGDAWYPRSVAKAISGYAFEEQVKWLDEQRYYVPFVFGKHKDAKVYDLTLKEGFNSVASLERMEDYFLRDNKLYLMPGYITRSTRERGSLHGFDIKVDLRLLEKVWGGPYGIEPGPLMTRHEYRNVVEAFHHVMQSDLTIKDITESIRRATGWETFKIEDRMSPNLDEAKRRLYDDMYISPATFIVAMPEELTKDKVRINVALGLVDPAKQSQTTYYFFMEVYRKETLIPEMDQETLTKRKKRETGTIPDLTTRHVERRVEDDVFDRGKFDANTFFDEEGPYAAMFDGAIGKDILSFSALLNLYHEQLGLPDIDADPEDVDLALDALTDRFGVRSERREGEDGQEYRVRRLKDVLRHSDPRHVAKVFEAHRRFRYDPFDTNRTFLRTEPVTSKEPRVITPIHHKRETINFDGDPLFSLDSNMSLDHGSLDETYDPAYTDQYQLDEDLPLDSRPNQAEFVALRYMTQPEIPREFRAEPYYAKHRIVVRPNNDGTSGFRLEGSNDRVTWTAIEEVVNDPEAEKIPFTHDVTASNTRYYRVRSFIGGTASLPTLPMDKTVIPT